MKKQALTVSILCLFSGASIAGFSLGRPAAVKKRVSKLDDKVRAAQTVPNRAPVISGMVAVSTTVVTDGTASISAVASDRDGDALTYVWTSTAGVVSGAGAVVNWVAPSTPGVYAVSCAVSDGKATAVRQSITLTAVPPGTQKWAFTTGDAIQSSPAIGADGTIYTGSLDGKLYAINPDGSEKWSFATSSAIWASPVVGADGTIYAGSNNSNLYAINPDGTRKWEFVTSSAIWGSPAIDADGAIYAGSGDARLYAVNPDGSEKWSFVTSSAIWSSPVIKADTVYVGSDDGKLYARYTSDGSFKWTFVSIFGTPINSSPAIGADGTVYTEFDDDLGYGLLYAINPSDGSEKWYCDAFWDIVQSPAIGADGTIYAGSDDWSLYAIDPDDPATVSGAYDWDFATGGAIRSSPAIGADGTVYVGSDDGKLYAIDTITTPAQGTEKWAFTAGGAIQSSPAIGADGTVYAGSLDGKLYAIYGNTALADTPWPKFRRNAGNTGR